MSLATSSLASCNCKVKSSLGATRPCKARWQHWGRKSGAGMDRAAVRERYEREWEPWEAMLAATPSSVTRHPGGCGTWTIHDVVGHVQCYARYHLVQVRAAFSHVVPTVPDTMGGRDPLAESSGGLHARNEAMPVAGLSLTWEQLRDEADWLRTETVAWVDGRTDDELEEGVGWIEFWNPDFPGRPDELPLHVRRVREAPSALMPMPVWQFVLPDKPPDHHVTEHLQEIRRWLDG